MLSLGTFDIKPLRFFRFKFFDIMSPITFYYTSNSMIEISTFLTTHKSYIESNSTFCIFSDKCKLPTETAIWNIDENQKASELNIAS